MPSPCSGRSRLPRRTKVCGCRARLRKWARPCGRLDADPLNAIVSLGGCSASFVSPQGLVATNHHCVFESIQYHSKEGQDYLTDGFLAKSPG
ncbi:S46 family peptidase [Mesorhizobium sp. M0018]|uniref:S46 family peptidase n=1 Tax=Mesorhizobium sp. M0018 TaxID=2956844 RepID=UPI003339E134